MARLWPEKLPSSVRLDKRRRAETRVYDKLSEVLDDKFVVFYSSPWLGTDHLGNERDGECDFLIAHPDYGFLAIEVKGGKEISFDPRNGQWFSKDHLDITHSIRNPIEQARKAKHEILAKLKNSKKFPSRYIHVAHGVIFPSARGPNVSLGVDRDKKIFCGSSKFNNNLGDWIAERLKIGGRSAGTEPLGNDGVATLERLLAHPFTLSHTIGSALEEDEYEFRTLEPSQFHILDYASDVARICVQGGAGTGKTVVALEEATRIASSGLKTLLTCYSKPLAEVFKHKLKRVENLDIGTFHSVCRQVAIKAGLSIPDNETDDDIYESKLPTALNDAMDSRPILRWDAIIVDEGQDFRQHWWIAVNSSLKDGGKLRIFWDSNQIVYNSSGLDTEYIETAPMRLNRNLRNTRKIHDVTSIHYEGIPVRADGPLGENVVWKIAESTEAKVKVAIKELRKLVKSQEVAPSDIGVLVNSNEVRLKLLDHTIGTDIPVTSAENLVSEGTVIDTVRRFKGLERRAIIVIIDGSDMQQRELAYVAFSRARSYLCVVHSERDECWLQGGK